MVWDTKKKRKTVWDVTLKPDALSHVYNHNISLLKTNAHCKGNGRIYLMFLDYPLLLKSLGSGRLFNLMFSYAHQGCKVAFIKEITAIMKYFNLKQLSCILIYFKCNFPLNVTVSCDGQNWIFSVTWSFRKHFNMLIWCSRIFFYYECWKQLCCFFYRNYGTLTDPF